MNKLTNGFIFSGAYVILALLLYIAGPDLATNQWIGLVRGAAMLGVLIYITLGIRKTSVTGFISFKELFVPLFITVVTYSVVSVVFDFVLFHLIDPSYMEMIKESAIDKMMNAPWIDNMSDVQVEKMITDTEERFDKAFTPLGILFSFGFKLISWTVLSLILAAIFKKKQPDFA